MAESGTGRLASSFKVNEFALYYFTVDSDWPEVTQLVGYKFTVIELATKVVNTVLNLIRLKCMEEVRGYDCTYLSCFKCVLGHSILRRDDRTGSSLYNGLHKCT